MKKLIIYTDGASRGNPGPAGIGIVICDESAKVLKEYEEFIGTATNNIAEYRALIKALELASSFPVSEIDCFSDSELMVKQLNGEYSVKNEKLGKLFLLVREKEKRFKKVNYFHVPREADLLKRADKLANIAIDEKMSNESEQKKAFLDVAVSICPYCGTPYADASWYAIKLGSDVECGVCGRTWNPKASKVDRILLEFLLDENGKVIEVKKKKRIENSQKPRDSTRLTQHFFFLEKRKPVLKEKQKSSFGKAFLSKKRFLVKSAKSCGYKKEQNKQYNNKTKMHWSLAIAKDIVERRKERKHVVATGITPSGDIHVGNLREIIIADSVHSALIDMGMDARLIYIADTFDPLRRRYSFLPGEYETHVGKPLSEIPDPEGCHSSYADHFLQPFLDSLADLGVKIEIFKADEMYKSEMYVDVIKEAIARREDLSRIIEEVSGRQLPAEWTPFNPLCDACGRITSAIVKGYNLDKQEVYYECECGNKNVASLRGGGKLAWRIDWAARWKILGVTIEPFGKDHAAPGGSYDTGKRISSEIYNYEAPYPIPFEHILLKMKEEEGMKAKITAMSSSRGTNIPVHEMLEAVPPEILKHVISRVRPDKHIEFDPSLPLLHLIDEYEREIGGIGRGVAEEIPFRHFITLVQIARGNFSELLEVIKRSGYEVREENEEEIKEIRKKAKYVENWLRKYAPLSLKFELQSALPTEEIKNLSDAQKKALKLMAQEIKGGMSLSASDWHDKIYEVASATNTEAKEVFKAIYIALLKKPSGPRAGWLLASLETEFLKERFEAAEKI